MLHLWLEILYRLIVAYQASMGPTKGNQINPVFKVLMILALLQRRTS